MNRKTIIYIIVGILTYFSICINVFAYEEVTKEYTDYYKLYNYTNLQSKMPFTESSYQQFKNYMIDFIEENLDSSKTYIVSYYASYSWILLNPVPFEETDYIFSSESSGFYNNADYTEWYAFKYTFSNENNDILLENQGLKRIGASHMKFFNRIFTQEGQEQFLWSNKPLKYNKTIDDTKTYYKHVFQVVPEVLNQCGYESVGTYGIEYPIYSYLDLKFCDYKEQERVKVTYKIEYYFDDVLDSSKTEFKSDYLYTKIENYQDYSTDMYKLLDNKYQLTLNEDESLNVLKVYYRSPLYGTDKQAIDTSKSKVYLFFQYSEIKAMFPNVTFENFTQFQQLVVVVLFNLLYCVFLFFCTIVLLRACQKVWSWILGFVL